MRDEAVAGTRVRTRVASDHIVGAAARVSQTPREVDGCWNAKE